MASNVLEYILRIKDEATSQMENFGKALQTSSSGFTNFGKKAMKTGAIITAATIPLVLYGKSAFDLASQIEQGWVGVRKVYGGATSDIENLLTPAAKNLSIQFGKSKLEVIGVMDALAAMGATGSELINKTTQALQFSVLGQMDLDQAMKAVVATSAIYGVKGEELTKMLAAMNTAENTGAASMSDLADAVSTTGNVAKISGVSVKELNSMMSVLRQRGVNAGEAANALKTILTKLRSPTEDGQAVMDKYGISVFETTTKTGTFTRTLDANSDEIKRLQKVVESKTTSLKNYEAGISGANLSSDAMKKKQETLRAELGKAQQALAKVSGTTSTYTGTQKVLTDKMKDADAVLLEISKSWGKMTDAEKANMAQSAGMLYQKDKFLALMDDMSSSTSEYNKLLQSQGDDIKNVAGYYNELGIAQDSNAFKVQQATQRFAEMKEVVGSTLLVALTPFITKISELALKFSEMDPKMQTLITGIGLFAVVLGPVLMSIGMMSLGISAVITGFIALKGVVVALWALMATNPILLLIGAIVAITAATVIYANQQGWLRTQTENVQLAEQNLSNARTAMEEGIANLDRLENQLQLQRIAVEKQTDAVKLAEQKVNDYRKTYGETSEKTKLAERDLTEQQLLLEQQELNVKDMEGQVVKGREASIVKIDEYQAKSQSFQGEIKKEADGFQTLGDRIRGAWQALKDLISGQNQWNGMSKSGGGGGGGGGGSYADGGWVDKTEYAKVHQGEFMLSKDMLQGKKGVPDTVKNAVGDSGSGVTVEISAVVNTPIDILELGNIIGQQLAFAGR